MENATEEICGNLRKEKVVSYHLQLFILPALEQF